MGQAEGLPHEITGKCFQCPKVSGTAGGIGGGEEAV